MRLSCNLATPAHIVPVVSQLVVPVTQRLPTLLIVPSPRFGEGVRGGVHRHLNTPIALPQPAPQPIANFIRQPNQLSLTQLLSKSEFLQTPFKITRANHHTQLRR